MDSLWSDAAAAQCATPLALRAYTSRLIGGDRSLVLQGGGNTSFKTADTLHVKGSGSDLSAVQEAHFTALDLRGLRTLLDDRDADDAELMRRVDECKQSPLAPKPSIETLMHAALPFSHVEHAHADAVLAVANVASCEATCREVFGELAPVVPYRHSGVALARACKTVFESQVSPSTIGLILAYHGVVAFGHSARESYENLVRLVSLAEAWLQRRNAWTLPRANAAAAATDAAEILRAAASGIAGFPLAMHLDSSPEALAFARRADLAELSRQGPPTPQHAIFTKRLPLVDGDVDAYAAAYRGYLERNLGADAARIDAAPRIVLDPRFGLCAFGVNAHYAAVAAEVFRHDIDILSRASAHGEYRAATAHDIARAELEYGGFEQRVLARIAN
jgi:rhamnose utilization protein RhaD (predicted bifunctional aldolase and dehydrogenase)